MGFKFKSQILQNLVYVGLCVFVNKVSANCKDSDSPNSCFEQQCPLEYVYEFAHTDKDPERKLAYFREDVSVGAGHMNFHNSNPFWFLPKNQLMDRAGELFYYYHQQIESRYDTERFSLGMPKVIPYEDFLSPIKEGYMPNYPPFTTKFNLRGRPANMTLSDVPGTFKVDDLILWSNRLKEAVTNGYIIHQNGSKTPILSEAGVDLLARVSMSTKDSPNHKYYGCFHTYFHLFVGKISDPKLQYYKHFDVMQDFTTAMTDPLFYRFHRGVVNLMVSLKVKLPQYKPEELNWNNVKMVKISVNGDLTKKENQLTTFTQQWKPLMAHGFDFQTEIPAKVLFHILQHEEFAYNMEVENLSKYKKTATVRIFIAPVYDNNGDELSLQEQRMLFSELDKFKVTLKPGSQTITRHSTQSSVTVPLEKSTEILATAPTAGLGNLDMLEDPCIWSHRLMDQSEEDADITEEVTMPLTPQLARSNCGWPQHLLIPRGKKGGTQFVLFAMLTDWNQDKVRSHPEQDYVQASAYCGIFNDTYPDKRAMGYPFDRRVPDDTTIYDFLQPNMATAAVKIYHSDQIVPLDGTFDTMQE